MSQGPSIRVFQKSDSDKVKEFISDIIVNEFKFKLEFNTLDSDILEIDKIYNKSNRGCFWVAETVVNDNDYSNTEQKQQKQKIIGTTAYTYSRCIYGKKIDMIFTINDHYYLHLGLSPHQVL
ncbi:MAG: hypothetical protein ACJ719_04270 [Nitrososphaeraceae archaeon]